MSGDQPHRSITPPDQRDISAKKVWARKCSLPAIAPWIPQTVKEEGSSQQDVLSTRLPSTLHAVEEGEISGTQPHNHQPQTSEAHSFLYSIPQWQPPSTQSTGLQPSKRPSPSVPAQRARSPFFTSQLPSQRSIQLLPAQRTRPSSAGLQGLPPPSVLPRDPGRNERIPGIYRKDVLDGRIGIRPRNKKSTELQHIKSSQKPCGKKGIDLPRSMKVIIQQFMVANGYICPHQQTPGRDKPAFRNSLLVRLDLHNTFRITKETGDERRLIKSAWTSVDGYVSEHSTEWRAQGVFKQVSETAQPTFAAFTSSWVDHNWDGSTRDLTRAMMVTIMSPILSVSPDNTNRASRCSDSETFLETAHQVIVLDDDSKGSLANPHAEPQPTPKRSGQDGPNNQANKRARTRAYAPITSKHEYVDHDYGEGTSLEFTRPEEIGLPIVIEAIHHARATMLDLVPMSAKDLAVMQQDWSSHGFPSMLAETLTIGRDYVATMGEYFDNALDALSLLRESSHWKAGHIKVQVDCDCQKGGAAPEQWQNARVPDPLICSTGEVQVRHSHEREDTVLDRSQDGKVFDGPIPPIGYSKVDRTSQLEGAAPDQSHKGVASDPPVAMAEKAQVDPLYQLKATTPDQVHDEEVADPEARSGTADNPCTL
ncbi:MAG: hypothetical protein Q9175_004480 [Cornicularia normoerica]